MLRNIRFPGDVDECLILLGCDVVFIDRSLPTFGEAGCSEHLRWGGKLPRSVTALSVDTASHPTRFERARYPYLSFAVLTFEDELLHAVFAPRSLLLAKQQNHVTTYSGYARFFVPPSHSVLSSRVYLPVLCL